MDGTLGVVNPGTFCVLLGLAFVVLAHPRLLLLENDSETWEEEGKCQSSVVFGKIEGSDWKNSLVLGCLMTPIRPRPL